MENADETNVDALLKNIDDDVLLEAFLTSVDSEEHGKSSGLWEGVDFIEGFVDANDNDISAVPLEIGESGASKAAGYDESGVALDYVPVEGESDAQSISRYVAWELAKDNDKDEVENDQLKEILDGVSSDVASKYVPEDVKAQIVEDAKDFAASVRARLEILTDHKV